ncbi:MAG: hypothetical protein R3B95_07670 [Nitrospirales bacterium]
MIAGQVVVELIDPSTLWVKCPLRITMREVSPPVYQPRSHYARRQVNCWLDMY